MILVLIIFLILIILAKREGYSTGTASADLFPQFLNVGNDVPQPWITTNATLVSTVNKLQIGDLNRYSWTNGYVGFRKTLQAGGGGQVYFLKTAPTNSNLSVVSPVIAYSKGVAIPQNVILLNSRAKPELDKNCVYTRSMSCPAVVGSTPSYYSDTYTLTTPATGYGNCQVAGGQTLTGSLTSPGTTLCACGAGSGGSSCTSCGAGTYSTGGSLNACSSWLVSTCPAGQGYTAGTTSTSSYCTNCPSGTYKSTSGTDACINWSVSSCPAGYGYAQGTTTTNSACTECNFNTYSSGGQNVCTSCPSGWAPKGSSLCYQCGTGPIPTNIASQAYNFYITTCP